MRSGATGERQRDQLNGLVHDSRKSAFSALGVATNDGDVNSVLIDRGDGLRAPDPARVAGRAANLCHLSLRSADTHDGVGPEHPNVPHRLEQGRGPSQRLPDLRRGLIVQKLHPA